MIDLDNDQLLPELFDEAVMDEAAGVHVSDRGAGQVKAALRQTYPRLA